MFLIFVTLFAFPELWRSNNKFWKQIGGKITTISTNPDFILKSIDGKF